MAKPSQDRTPPPPADLIASRRFGLPRDAFIPGTGLTWEGRARMAAARLGAGLSLNELDVEALTKNPEAALHLPPGDVDAALGSFRDSRNEERVEVPAQPREPDGDYASPREVDPVVAGLVDRARAAGSRAAAEAAIAQADAAADPGWQHAARQVIDALAAERETFTTDDVWRGLTAAHADAATHEPRALGALMLAAARDGVIATLDQWQPSDRIVNHGRPLRVWKSLRVPVDA